MTRHATLKHFAFAAILAVAAPVSAAENAEPEAPAAGEALAPKSAE